MLNQDRKSCVFRSGVDRICKNIFKKIFFKESKLTQFKLPCTLVIFPESFSEAATNRGAMPPVDVGVGVEEDTRDGFCVVAGVRPPARGKEVDVGVGVGVEEDTRDGFCVVAGVRPPAGGKESGGGDEADGVRDGGGGDEVRGGSEVVLGASGD